MDFSSLLKKFYEGDFQSLARIISLVENSEEGCTDILLNLKYPDITPVIGITGPPGAGKSTLINGLVDKLALDGTRVGIIAIDPSSPFNLGSLLGDRLRMSGHFLNPDIFIRSVATQGSLGGISDKTIEITDVMRAFGFDYIIIETVGVGQSEIEIAGLADITMLVLMPGSGDEVQFLKAGILEVADVIALNKSDIQGADMMMKTLSIALSGRNKTGSPIPVFRTTATENKGTDDLSAWVKKQFQNLSDSGNRPEKKLWLLAEKAYRLIQKERMKDISKQHLMDKLAVSLKSNNFNLYRFVRDSLRS